MTLPNDPTAVIATKNIDRRTVLRSAAWSAPVIALAIASPAASASGDPTPPKGCQYGNYPGRGSGGDSNDNGWYQTIYADGHWYLDIHYSHAPDIYEVNAKFEGLAPDTSYGTNYGTAPAAGTLIWRILTPAQCGNGTQVHTFNTHISSKCT